MFGSIPSFHGRDWKPSDVGPWSILAKEAGAVTSRAGSGRAFQETLNEARRLLRAGDMDAVVAQLHRRRFSRAVVKLWYDDDRLARQTMRRNLLEALVKATSPLSRLTTITLASVHLKHFDRLDDWEEGLFEAVRTALSRAVSQQRILRGVPDVVESLRERPGLLTHRAAPEALAHQLITQGESLTDFLERRGILGYDDGRFGELVRLHYFLERIRRADPSQEHEFLAELTSESVSKAPMSDGKYFGHVAIEALTDQPGQSPSMSWLRAILDIGGDPRLRHSAKWREWWEPVSEAARSRMVGWLSAEDLRLFLTAVEEYGKESCDAKLLRMFPDRKEFLLGLHDQGLVQETRLILGNGARMSVRRQLGQALRSDIAVLQGDSRKPVIFVDCGTFHLVEGSHDFKLWVYKGRPVELLTNRKRRFLSPHELRAVVPASHEQANGSFNRAAHTGIVHHGPWQHKALSFLASWGISLPADKLMSKDTYEAMKRGPGIPVAR